MLAIYLLIFIIGTFYYLLLVLPVSAGSPPLSQQAFCTYLTSSLSYPPHSNSEINTKILKSYAKAQSLHSQQIALHSGSMRKSKLCRHKFPPIVSLRLCVSVRTQTSLTCLPPPHGSHAMHPSYFLKWAYLTVFPISSSPQTCSINYFTSLASLCLLFSFPALLSAYKLVIPLPLLKKKRKKSPLTLCVSHSAFAPQIHSPPFFAPI